MTEVTKLKTIHSHNYLLDDEDIEKNEKKTFIVVVLTSIMMVFEIVTGYLTGSMALLADGWHMASHAGALSISLVAYRLAKSGKMNEMFSFGAGKFIPLGGYTSAIALALIAILMAFESIQRLITPQSIKFSEAIIVAIIGLAVNVISAFILSGHHHHHGHNEHDHGHDKSHKHVHDHNLRSAYIHVIADAFTSVLAIFALAIGMWNNAVWLDSLMGIVGSIVILKWAYNLCRDAGWELLDGQAKSINTEKIKEAIEGETTIVADLHVWRIAPKAIACELVVLTKTNRGVAYYRTLLTEKFGMKHIIVEERPWET